MRRLVSVLLVLVPCACGGQGARALQAFGEALVLVALIVLVLVVVAAALYLVTWIGLLRSFRKALQPGGDGAAARRAWWLALVATLVHAVLVALTSEQDYGAGDTAWSLVLASVIPVGALAFAAALAARAGVRWPAIVTLALGLPWALFMVESWRMRPLSELPGRVVQLASINLHSCARLSTGQVACLGANWQGQRGDGSTHAIDAPTLVRGIDDAAELSVAGDLGCVLRREHGATCWGGDDALPVPGPRRLPWALPGGEDAVRLVASERGIVVLTRDGALKGWPDPPPAGLERAQALFGDDDFDGAWFCAVDLAGALACWESRRPGEPVRFEVPPVVAFAIDADAEVACAADDAGTVRCFDLDRRRPGRTVGAPGLRQLVAVDDDGTFCALQTEGRVTCWRDQEPAREPAELVGVERIFAGGGLVCGERGDERRCLSPRGEPAGNAVELLERDRSP